MPNNYRTIKLGLTNPCVMEPYIPLLCDVAGACWSSTASLIPRRVVLSNRLTFSKNQQAKWEVLTGLYSYAMFKLVEEIVWIEKSRRYLCIWLDGKQSFHQYRKVFKPIGSFLSVQDLVFVSECPSLIPISSSTNGCWKRQGKGKHWVFLSLLSQKLFSCLSFMQYGSLGHCRKLCPLCCSKLPSSEFDNIAYTHPDQAAFLTEGQESKQNRVLECQLSWHTWGFTFLCRICSCSSSHHEVSTWQGSFQHVFFNIYVYQHGRIDGSCY